MITGSATRIVLIVDDSPQVAANLEIALSSVDGIEPVAVGSAHEALRELQQLDCASRLAAVITDLEMPRMNGYELIEKLRADARWVKTPIIVSSGSSDPESRGKALRAGADAYFAKPYSTVELRKRLTSLIDGDRK